MTDKNSEPSLRSPICCVLGHVDAGKTSLLDKIRETNLQHNEAGGITQQIGATYFSKEILNEKTSIINTKKDLILPGLLIIDTPGHESFTNLRTRGSNLCDLVILVVNIFHGLLPQTIESINILKARKIPFIIALNQVDRLNRWKTPNSEETNSNISIAQSFKSQELEVKKLLEERVNYFVTQFAEQSLNVSLYWKNKDFKSFISIIPTSAKTGEGIPDLLMMIIKLSEKFMKVKLMKNPEITSNTKTLIQCNILEVKVTEGFGTTLDVILVNGTLHEGDTIVLPSLSGPIVTKIRALLVPHNGKQLGEKGTNDNNNAAGKFLHMKEVNGAMGLKIAGSGLDKAIAGSELFVAHDKEVEHLKEKISRDIEKVIDIGSEGIGVHVQASSLGSLEALIHFLKQNKIPIGSFGLGPIHKKDLLKCLSRVNKQKSEYNSILAFDTELSREVADKYNKECTQIKIFQEKVIYKLVDDFVEYSKDLKNKRKQESLDGMVWSVTLRILPFVFNIKDPIIIGCRVLEGTLRIGTPLCVYNKEISRVKEIMLGKVTSIESNNSQRDHATVGEEVAVKIEGSNYTYGRHFQKDDIVVSKVTRESLDIAKEHYKDELNKEEKILLFKLKKIFNIQ